MGPLPTGTVATTVLVSAYGIGGGHRAGVGGAVGKPCDSERRGFAANNEGVAGCGVAGDGEAAVGSRRRKRNDPCSLPGVALLMVGSLGTVLGACRT